MTVKYIIVKMKFSELLFLKITFLRAAFSLKKIAQMGRAQPALPNMPLFGRILVLLFA